MTGRPKVSIVVSTYNHRPYISQALDSILSQDTDFEYEILVGDDASDDGTQEIVRRYAADAPEVVRPFLNDHLDVVRSAEDGFGLVPVSGRRLAVQMLSSARGQYMGLLDGDDFWLNSRKMQKQADFLDAHPECSACFHSAARIVEGEGGRSIMRPPGRRPYYGVKDLLEGNFVPTGSLLYRNGLFGELPSWFFEVAMGDRPLLLLNALHGKLGYIDETLTAYRVHAGGVWSSSPPERRLALMINAYDVYKTNLPYRYYLKCVGEQAKLAYRRTRALSEETGVVGSTEPPSLHQVVLGHALLREMPTRRLAGLLLNLYAPGTARSLRAVRSLLTRED